MLDQSLLVVRLVKCGSPERRLRQHRLVPVTITLPEFTIAWQLEIPVILQQHIDTVSKRDQRNIDSADLLTIRDK